MKQMAKRAVLGLASLGLGGWGLYRSGVRGEGDAPPLAGVKSILVIRLNLLGDVVFTLPALAALRAAAPTARITMLVLPYTADIVRASGLVDRIITADVNRWRSPSNWVSGRASRGVRDAVADLRKEKYDLCISFYGQAGAAFALLSGARFTVGYESEGYARGFDLAVPGKRYAAPRHEAEYCLDLVRALAPGRTDPNDEEPESGTTRASVGVRDDPDSWNLVGAAAPLRVPPLSVVADAEGRVDRLLADACGEEGKPLVAIHPGALNMSAKRWFSDRWAAVADRLQGELGVRVLLVGSESEVPLAEMVRREMRSRPLMMAGKTSIPELAALLRRCRLFIGGDSGPLHLASALAVPSLSIYGPTDPANTGPLGPDARVLRGTAECMPCYRLDRPAVCWRGDLLCMAQVSEDRVFETAREMLAGIQESTPSEADSPTGTPSLPRDSRYLIPETHPTDRSSALRRILVVKLAGIGDLLTAFPALEALRTRYPHAELTALVTPQSATVLHGSGLVDRVIELDKYVFDTAAGFIQLRSLAALARLGARLRQHSFDAVVLLHHLVTAGGIAKYAVLTMATGARVRAGLDDGRGWFLNVAARDRGFGDVHEVDYWLEVVSLLGAVNREPAITMAWGHEEERYADDVWRALGLGAGEEVVAIHPGTGSYSPVRRWYPERFAAVAEALAGDGLTAMVVAGPDEEALAGEVITRISGRSALLAGTPTPRHLAAVLARCRLFVGNDSGVMHVAGAAGLPVVAVFGPSNHRAWGPYDPFGRRSRVVRVDLPCSPCLYRGQSLGLRDGCGDPQCLERISVKSVVAAARDLLSQAGQSPSLGGERRG